MPYTMPGTHSPIADPSARDAEASVGRVRV